MIVTLCGSGRFEEYFKKWNEALSLAGHIVFTTSVYPSFKDGNKEWYTKNEKRILDLIHFGKIDISEAILILNAYSYIGDSTLNEIEYAKIRGKEVFALESWGEGIGILSNHTKKVIQEKESFGIPSDFVSPINTMRFKSSYDLFNGVSDRGKLVDIVESA